MSEQTNINDNGSGTEESSVIRELREQNKTLNKQVEALNEQASSFSQGREEAIQTHIDRLGFPKLKDVVIDKVDGFPTEDKVAAVLADLGLTEPQAPAGNATETPQAPSVQEVAGLGQQAASAASTSGVPDLDAQINAATTKEEVAAIMTAAGLSQ